MPNQQGSGCSFSARDWSRIQEEPTPPWFDGLTMKEWRCWHLFAQFSQARIEVKRFGVGECFLVLDGTAVDDITHSQLNDLA